MINKKRKRTSKKYNDKSIRILNGKNFTKSVSLNSAQRRKLVKNKNLIKELLKITNKYLPELFPLFSELTDKRNKSYITYKMKTIIIARLFILICGITTMTEIGS